MSTFLTVCGVLLAVAFAIYAALAVYKAKRKKKQKPGSDIYPMW